MNNRECSIRRTPYGWFLSSWTAVLIHPPMGDLKQNIYKPLNLYFRRNFLCCFAKFENSFKTQYLYNRMVLNTKIEISGTTSSPNLTSTFQHNFVSPDSSPMKEGKLAHTSLMTSLIWCVQALVGSQALYRSPSRHVWAWHWWRQTAKTAWSQKP